MFSSELCCGGWRSELVVHTYIHTSRPCHFCCFVWLKNTNRREQQTEDKKIYSQHIPHGLSSRCGNVVYLVSYGPKWPSLLPFLFPKTFAPNFPIIAHVKQKSKIPLGIEEFLILKWAKTVEDILNNICNYKSNSYVR